MMMAETDERKAIRYNGNDDDDDEENLLDAADEHISSANLSRETDPSTSSASDIFRLVIIMMIMWKERSFFQEKALFTF